MKEDDKNIQQEYEEGKSKLVRRSIAHAAINLPLDSIFLEVYPVEEIGYTSTDVNDERETHVEDGEDAFGNAYVDEIETSNCIVAEWLPWGSNRYTAPNVRRGEKVILWQYDEVDKYYWTIMGTEDYLRRLETVAWNFSNTRDESVKKLTKENSYTMIMSTHTKEVTLQTCKSDGEKFEYIIRLDTKNNMFVITDDDNNQITLESDERRITLLNGDGASVCLDKKNITIDAPDTITLNAKTVKVNADNHEVKAKTSSLDATTQTVKVETSSLKASKYNMNASSYDLDGGSMTFKTGRLIAEHGAEIRGSLTNNGVNVGSTHTHSGVDTGPGYTGSPR